MTAVSLFDLLARDERELPSGAEHSGQRLSELGKGLIEAAMADWGRLCDYERRFTYPDSGDERLGLEMLESLRRLQQAWVTDAQEVLGRVRRLSNAGAFPQIELLEDTIGSALARLSLSPQQIAGARRQMMAGQTIPARELRNELQARLHA